MSEGTVPHRSIRILLVAPNVSVRMGGEAIKSYHTMRGLQDLGLDVIQLTHERVRAELREACPDADIRYITDEPILVMLHRLKMGWLFSAWSSWLLHRAARKIARSEKLDIVHFTSPISPTMPYFRIGRVPVVIGPLNGNLLHPPAFIHRESGTKKLGAAIIAPFQMIVGGLFRGKRYATLIISGGERTVRALKLAGCTAQQMVHTLDSGVGVEFVHMPRQTHSGENHRFVFAGRLIRLKGVDLLIRALRNAPQARLDIIGDGDERNVLESLARSEGVADRVHFHGWVAPGTPMRAILARARAFVFPSLAEANGIVIQEAMMTGLPVVALNWGGPAALLDADTGILIDPLSESHVINELSTAMKMLGSNFQEAERLSANARAAAEAAGFAWNDLLDHWNELYKKLVDR